MGDSNQIEARELLPRILNFSQTLSECTSYVREAERYLYATIFVRAANENNASGVIDEFQREWSKARLSLFQLIPNLFDMFGDLRHPEWNMVRTLIVQFYKTYDKSRGPSNYCNDPTKKIPQHPRPLPSMYHSIRNEIQKLKESKAARLKASQGLLAEIQSFESNNKGLQCPVRKRNVVVPKTAEPEVVWKEKEEGFRSIFQRTRELFLFHNEEAHFHHAAAILEFMHEALKRQYKPDSRKDQVAFAKQAEGLQCFQKLFVAVMEKSQECLKIDDAAQYVTSKMALSRQFAKVRTLANKDFEKKKKLLGGLNFVLPGLVETKASLAVSLYRLMRERRKAYDDVAYFTDKIKKQVHQLEGWERVTGMRNDVPMEENGCKTGGEIGHDENEAAGGIVEEGWERVTGIRNNVPMEETGRQTGDEVGHFETEAAGGIVEEAFPNEALLSRAEEQERNAQTEEEAQDACLLRELDEVLDALEDSQI